jgi:hypothetical protein
VLRVVVHAPLAHRHIQWLSIADSFIAYFHGTWATLVILYETGGFTRIPLARNGANSAASRTLTLRI